MNRTSTMRRGARLLAVLLCVCLLCAALPVFAAETAAFHYQHDPRLNPSAMADIIADPTAIYGFSPSPDGSLAAYAAYDWSDPELVNGENGRLARIAYHESIAEMYTMLDEMTAAGNTIEEIARAVSTKRNEIRLAAYDNDPEGLATAKARNLERYGHEEGPLPDELYEQYGSWEIVIEKAFSTNSGMDACLGLYDDYYDLYIAAGQIAPESETPATREYVIAAIADAVGLALPAADALDGFADADELSAWYAPEMAAAIAAGVISGYEDGTLKPQNSIRLIELAVIASRCLSEVAETEDAAAFTDVPAWAQSYVDHLTRTGFFGDDGTGLFEPDALVTVAEANEWRDLVRGILFGGTLHVATEKDQAIFEELAAASDIAAIFSRHPSVTIEVNVYSGGEIVDTRTLFADADTFVRLEPGEALAYQKDLQLIYYEDYADAPVQVLRADGAYAEFLEAWQEYLSLVIGENETLRAAMLRDGVWCMCTEIDDAAYVQGWVETYNSLSGAAREYQEGMKAVYEYYFDAESTDLLYLVSMLERADGATEMITMSLHFYGEPFDLAATPLAPYFTAAEEDMRTITVVFDADTETQRTETWRVPAGVYFDIDVGGEWADYYTDPECTQVYDTSGWQTDDGITVYVRADGT